MRAFLFGPEVRCRANACSVSNAFSARSMIWESWLPYQVQSGSSERPGRAERQIRRGLGCREGSEEVGLALLSDLQPLPFLPCMDAIARHCGCCHPGSFTCRAGEPGLQNKGGWDAELARYLRAEKYNVQKAEKRLREQTVWRTEFFPKGEFTEVCHQHSSGCTTTSIARCCHTCQCHVQGLTK